MSDSVLTIEGASLTLADVERVACNALSVQIADAAWQRMVEARKVVLANIEKGEPLYGVTTGVGSQKDFSYDKAAVQQFNESLIRAHATYIPEERLNPEEVRATLLILINSYAEGTSGIRPETVERLLAGLNGGFEMDIRENCSVGAGDLVPLTQIAAAFIDDTDKPLTLDAKEALSLMCSNAVALAKAALAIVETKRLLVALDIACATALEGFRGNPTALTASKQYREGLVGLHASARSLENVLMALKESTLWQEGEPRFLQDPLSYRCMGHINGAAWQALHWAETQVIAEINASTDNPRVDRASGKLISHANIDSTLLTATLDALRQTLAKAMRMSAERLHKQHWPSFSGLPVGLTREGDAAGGIQFLNISHLAESQLAPLQHMAAPALLHYGGQLADGVEDAGGMATFAAYQLQQMQLHGWNVLALELITAVWAIDRREVPPDKLGLGVRPVFEAIRPLLPIGTEGEKVFDMAPVVEWIQLYTQQTDIGAEYGLS